MMAAAAAADAGEKVILLEKNEKLGKSFLSRAKAGVMLPMPATGRLFFENVLSNPEISLFCIFRTGFQSTDGFYRIE